MTTFRIKKLADLVEGWRKVSPVRAIVEELTKQVTAGKEPFLGKPLPEELVHGRMPPGIESAWVFVLKPETKTKERRHPGSIHHMAVIAGNGTFHIGRRTDYLQPFDPAFPVKSVYVIPENTPHSFESGHEPLVLMSFHTVPAGDLVEIEIEGGRRKKYVEGQRGKGEGRRGKGEGRRDRG